MNITHAVKEEITGDKLDAIFNRQKELMDKYHDIEKRSGLMQTEDCPVSLDSKFGQARIKDFSWRITEEVGEALDALYGDDDMEHFQEELVDGLHFLVELTILVGVTPEYLTGMILKREYLEHEDKLDLIFGNNYIPDKLYPGYINASVTELIRKLGMMCNTLKNKPWKQSHMKTDINVFTDRLGEVWKIYLCLLYSALGSTEAIADVYLKKSQVNKFRQRSNY